MLTYIMRGDERRAVLKEKEMETGEKTCSPEPIRMQKPVT